MHLSRLDDLEPFTTLDGSTIREIVGPASLPAHNQSLAEATVPPGTRTAAHFHRRTEELYFFTAGPGAAARRGRRARRGARATAPSSRPARCTSCATPAPSALRAAVLLRPAYAHDDTVLVDDGS